MKKLSLTFFMIAILMIFLPSCKSTFVWNPVGDWTITVTITSLGTATETIIFTGTEAGGTITGWEFLNPSGITGTWTKTGDYSLTITIDFWNGPWNNIVNITGTSSEANPNSMTGSGTWTEIWGDVFIHTMSFTAIKTSNQQ